MDTSSDKNVGSNNVSAEGVGIVVDQTGQKFDESSNASGDAEENVVSPKMEID